MENLIQDITKRFPKIAAGVPNAQLDFERAKEVKNHAFVADFMKEYHSTGLPPGDICSITFGRWAQASMNAVGLSVSLAGHK